MGARALIFRMNIPCDKTFPWVPLFFTLLPWPSLDFDPFYENFKLANNFWTVSARALIFHMNISCDKNFPRVLLFFYHVTLTLEFDPFFKKTLTLLITFEQWVLELTYFTWIFLVIRPFRGYYYFLTCDLGLWPIFWKLYLANNFWTVSARALIFLMDIPSDKIFLLVLNLLTLTFDLFFFGIDIGHNF